MPSSSRPAVARSVLAVLVVGAVAGTVTAGGPVFLATDVAEVATGYRPDGIGLIVPGLVATALVALAAAVGLGCALLGQGRVPAAVRARRTAAAALLPMIVAASVALAVVARHSSGRTLGWPATWWSAAGTTAVCFTVAALALVVALATRRGTVRVVAASVATAALGVGGAAQPAFVSVSLLGGSLAVATLLLSLAPSARSSSPR